MKTHIQTYCFATIKAGLQLKNKYGYSFLGGREIKKKIIRGQAKKTNICKPSVWWATIFGTRMSLRMLLKLEFTAVGKCVWQRGKIYGVMESVIVFFKSRRWSSGELKQTVGTNTGLFFWKTKVKNVDQIPKLAFWTCTAVLFRVTVKLFVLFLLMCFRRQWFEQLFSLSFFNYLCLLEFVEYTKKNQFLNY